MAGLPHKIIKETQHLLAEPVPEPDESNAHYFHVVAAGPQDSPFEGGTFKLELFLPEEYPMQAWRAAIHEVAKNKLGRICLDVLNRWSPTLASKPDNPLQWKAKEAQATETARAQTRLYAMNNIYTDPIIKSA
ncbi:hypothetical protein K5549_010215 [Capra hircus]|nr:hypothetical protein K5549_010215 [Capra hircus]